MRRTMVAAAFAAAALFLAPGGASAASATASPGQAQHGLLETVQHYPDRYGHGGFDQWDGDRHHRRHMRRAYEQDRIAEAARREARRIEIERAERRAWRHAHRERSWRHDRF